MSDMRCENCTYWTGGLRLWGYCTQHSKDTSNTDSCIMWMDSGWVIKKQCNNHSDTNVGNIEYICKQDAVEAVRQAVNRGYGTDYGVIDSDVVYEVLDGVEPADVVQVVRCADCKYHTYDEVFEWDWCNCEFGERKVVPDDFCSYGKKREG